MGRTFLRQDTQIHRSVLYDDTIAPTEAAYETNPTNIEDDLNAIRSMAHTLLKNRAGNWYDDLNIPATLDTGSKRGVNDLNSALHLVERKRVLATAYSLQDVSVPAEVKATGTLTASVNFGDTETVTIGSKVYTFQTTLTNVDGNIQIGGTLADSLQNLYDAINLTGTPGTQYATAMTAHTTVDAISVDGTTVGVRAKLGGTQGNLIVTTDTAANASWGAGTLTGGSGDIVILALSELPTDTTAAIGAVTTLGTVAANNATFGAAALSLVAGSNALSPKNLAYIEDTVTHDPILSGGRVVYALFQTESATDGSTMTGTTPNRAQLTFVRINTGGTALELCPSSDIAGKTIHYSTNTRKALEDLTEQDFLRGAVIDIPASVTVTRQIAYDNQGTTPVNVTTNSTLDLEGPGLIWSIRDDLEANLLRVIEGSAGGTSEVHIGSDVDTFNVDAVVNDFLNGIKVDTGSAGTTINVGVTANQIDSGGSLKVASGGGADLSLAAALELNLTDSYRAGSTWSLADGVALANSSQEWSDFETSFGEVSLLKAITLAASAGNVKKTYANVTATTTKDNDVGGSGGGSNLDAQIHALNGGDFLVDHDVFLNGQLLRPGATNAANHDYYPGTSLSLGQLMFEFTVRLGDVLCVISRA